MFPLFLANHKRQQFDKVNRSHPYHHLGDLMVRVTNHYPRALLRKPPAWTAELTAEPVV